MSEDPVDPKWRKEIDRAIKSIKESALAFCTTCRSVYPGSDIESINIEDTPRPACPICGSREVKLSTEDWNDEVYESLRTGSGSVTPVSVGAHVPRDFHFVECCVWCRGSLIFGFGLCCDLDKTCPNPELNDAFYKWALGHQTPRSGVCSRFLARDRMPIRIKAERLGGEPE